MPVDARACVAGMSGEGEDGMKVNHICHHCGNFEEGNWTDDLSNKLQKEHLCFDCNFWFELIGRYHAEYPAVIIDRMHYVIERDDNRQHAMRGFGGREFKIRFKNTGKEVVTHNLWHQGTIPESFWILLPDNAEFIRQKEVKIGELQNA